MEMKDIIERVNYYSKIAKERVLTEEEKEQREVHRKAYIEAFKGQVRGHLEGIKIVDSDKLN